MEDTKPKGMGLLKQAPVVRWIVVGGGMVPASGQIYPKEKGLSGHINQHWLFSLSGRKHLYFQ